MSALTRRAALAALPAMATLPAAAFAGAPQNSPAADPHPAWLAEWRKCDAAWNTILRGQWRGPTRNKAEEAISAEWGRLAELIVETPPATPRGFRAQLELALEQAVDDEADIDMDRRVVERLIAVFGGRTGPVADGSDDNGAEFAGLVRDMTPSQMDRFLELISADLAT